MRTNEAIVDDRLKHERAGLLARPGSECGPGFIAGPKISAQGFRQFQAGDGPSVHFRNIATPKWYEK